MASSSTSASLPHWITHLQVTEQTYQYKIQVKKGETTRNLTISFKNQLTEEDEATKRLAHVIFLRTLKETYRASPSSPSLTGSLSLSLQSASQKSLKEQLNTATTAQLFSPETNHEEISLSTQASDKHPNETRLSRCQAIARQLTLPLEKALFPPPSQAIPPLTPTTPDILKKIFENQISNSDDPLPTSLDTSSSEPFFNVVTSSSALTLASLNQNDEGFKQVREMAHHSLIQLDNHSDPYRALQKIDETCKNYQQSYENTLALLSSITDVHQKMKEQPKLKAQLEAQRKIFEGSLATTLSILKERLDQLLVHYTTAVCCSVPEQLKAYEMPVARASEMYIDVARFTYKQWLQSRIEEHLQRQIQATPLLGSKKKHLKNNLQALDDWKVRSAQYLATWEQEFASSHLRGLDAPSKELLQEVFAETEKDTQEAVEQKKLSLCIKECQLVLKGITSSEKQKKIIESYEAILIPDKEIFESSEFSDLVLTPTSLL